MVFTLLQLRVKLRDIELVQKKIFISLNIFHKGWIVCRIWISFCVKRNHEEIKSATYTFRFSFISILLKRVAVPTFHVSTRVPKKYILINCLRWLIQVTFHSAYNIKYWNFPQMRQISLNWNFAVLLWVCR